MGAKIGKNSFFPVIFKEKDNSLLILNTESP